MGKMTKRCTVLQQAAPKVKKKQLSLRTVALKLGMHKSTLQAVSDEAVLANDRRGLHTTFSKEQDAVFIQSAVEISKNGALP